MSDATSCSSCGGETAPVRASRSNSASDPWNCASKRNPGRRIHAFECERPARREREQRRLPDANPLERQHGRRKSSERAQRHQRVLHLRIATRGKVPLAERDTLDDQLAVTRQFRREQTGQKRRVGNSVLGGLAHLTVVRIRDVDPADATFPQPSVCGRDEPSVIQLQIRQQQRGIEGRTGERHVRNRPCRIRLREDVIQRTESLLAQLLDR